MNSIDNEQLRIWSIEIRQSNRKAFDELFRYLYPRLVHFAMRFTKQKPEACDIVQDTFVILWQKRAEIDPDQSLKSYLFRIVRNRSINWLNKKVNQTESLEEQIPDMSSEEIYNEQSVELLESNFRMWINELPERQQEAFELSRFEGLNHDEIAEIMSVSPKTVNNHIVTALQSMREKYDHYKKIKEG
jgi:RNA polymerase sigma-70 factor, ECF subfamily